MLSDLRLISLPKKFAEKLDKLSSKPLVKYSVYLTAVILFFALILLPPILGIIIKWDAMQEVLGNSELIARALNAVKNSFTIAVLVSVLDVVAGIPMAWLVTRGKSRWLNVLDTLADVPFIVPTAVLGYSTLLFGVTLKKEFRHFLAVRLFRQDGFLSPFSTSHFHTQLW